MKKTLLITFALAGSFFCSAQTVTPVVLSNQGGYSALTAGSISWSIGEPVSESYSTPQRIHTMGFHQPELAIVTLIAEQGADKSILVFPNPVKDFLTVNFTGLTDGNYKVELIDNIGKLIYQTQTEVNESNRTFQLKVNEVAAGNYFLRVQNKDFSKTVKINKIN
jgi:Secretion system C-terminal sorting domain